jgi:serine/threonine protein kinase
LVFELSNPISIGDVLDERYVIESLIGRGGMGNVYLAQDLKLAYKKWAVKECELTGYYAHQFAEEANMLAKINHAKLPHVIDFMTSADGKYGYLVMDYMEGPSLQDYFNEKRSQIEVSLVVHIALQICDIFNYLHDFKPHPIIYRDLKPSNIMIDEYEQIKLIDFGIARHFSTDKSEDTIQLGTIGFAAPEQFHGKQTNPRSDIYALGALIYYLLSSGVFAYTRRFKLHEIRNDVDQSLSGLVEQLLAENPDHRFDTIRTFQQALLKLYPQHDLTSHQLEAKSSAKAPHRTHGSSKLVVVGGLYAGVGSTFISVSLARCLHAESVPHALIEHPTNEPDLYSLLFGEMHAPSSYVFVADMVKSNSSIDRSKLWEAGHTAWVPIPPQGFSKPWSVEDNYQLLFGLKMPVLVWDISTNWHDECTRKLCELADEILVVVDASPGKIRRPSSQRTFDLFDTYRALGKSIRFIANREERTHSYPSWVSSLPSLPIEYCAEIPSQYMKQAIQKGNCAQDQPHILEQLKGTFMPLIQKLLPIDSHIHDASLKRSLWKKWVGLQ